ncbi:MAG: carbamoyl-phosphate synthase large subunit [Bdellovibrionota bacterium]
MPKRIDIKKIFVIGSGPIQIGQGCEFDYSGTQACIALRDEGYEVVLVNSNPATIMTDNQTANKVYIEPLTRESLLKIIDIEKPHAILPTMGGQVALNLFMELCAHDDLTKRNIKYIGVNPETVKKAEDRREFKQLVEDLGYGVVKGGLATNRQEALELASTLKYPLIIRASFTLGGTGGGIAYNEDQFRNILNIGFSSSTHAELCIEESIIGWKEYELEVMRDCKGNFVVVCAIENINPMGVHTGDSITIAPCMTLTDREYQELRNCAKHIFEKIGMETGGANIQFALNPLTGRMVVIEMNPRVSRSSALVSKATGYPIARISAKLAIGLSLDEIQNEITGNSISAFEPAIDYVVIKIPRFDFEKFTGASNLLGIQMKSVGEVLTFGHNFKDAFQKAWRALEQGYIGFESKVCLKNTSVEDLMAHLQSPTPELFFYIKEALKRKYDLEEIHKITHVGKWFLYQINELVDFENDLQSNLNKEKLIQAKQFGFSNTQIADLHKISECDVLKLLAEYQIKPTFKMVDTCAAEFVAKTPYYYKTFENFNDNIISQKPRIVILGSGPNRIGQGIEFDYSCVHAVKAVQEMGYYAVMINSNPETVSTDYHTADKLYMEPLTKEDVLDILREENPVGVFIQFGGQSSLKIAKYIEEAGYKIFGTSFASIELTEDREKFGAVLKKLNLKAPEFGIAKELSSAVQIANKIGYPVLVRPSFVLGGRGMAIVHCEEELNYYFARAIYIDKTQPVLIDKYLSEATECDIDFVCDGENVFIPAILEHIEAAGIHSGDSSCVTPPVTISHSIQEKMRLICKQIAMDVKGLGLLNIQFAIKDDEIFIIEVNPRSSRTVPFVSKSTGIAMAQLATKVCLGKTLSECNLNSVIENKKRFCVKAPVFPFHKFKEFAPILGPEMRSIGEVMSSSVNLNEALYKAFVSAGNKLNPEMNVIFLKNESEFDFYEQKLKQEFLNSNLIEFQNHACENIFNLLQNKKISLIVAGNSHIDNPNVLNILHQSILLNIPMCFDKRSFEFYLKAFQHAYFALEAV